MPRHVFSLCLAVLLASCTAAQHRQDARKDAPPEGGEVYAFSDSVNTIRFFVSSHMDMRAGVQCRVDHVQFNDKASGAVIQDLPLPDANTLCPTPDGPFMAVEVADFNFDGHRDFRIMKAGSEPNHPAHRYWLFDPAIRGFAPSASLDSLQDPQFDHERKMVSSQWYESPMHRGGSTFRFENGRLTMVSNMEKFREGDHERWVVWGMKDGRFQPVNEKEVALPRH